MQSSFANLVDDFVWFPSIDSGVKLLYQRSIWHGQVIGVMLTLPFEHKTASVESVTGFPKVYSEAFVDDDWYYEMCAVRAFEKHCIGLSVQQLGEQWLENSCGSWGSSAMAFANLRRGITAPDCGHPRYNRRWWTIRPVFTADLFGALAPGMPNEAGRLARELCSINGYGEALDGGVIFAGATHAKPKVENKGFAHQLANLK